VQGMNFIVGSMLYHCTEEIAFWMFVTLIEEFEMRDIYEPKLPGLYKHCYVIKKLMKLNILKLYKHFVSFLNILLLTLVQKQFEIQTELYASDWIFCIFSNILPLTFMANFYDEFFT
jgi:Rab-GTPase-TBC domain